MSSGVERIERAAALLSRAYVETDGFGVAHEIVATGSVSAQALDECRNRSGLVPSEVEAIECLRELPGRDRLIAYYLSVADGQTEANLLRAIAMADDDIARFGPVDDQRLE